MSPTRRHFLKLSAMAGAAASLPERAGSLVFESQVGSSMGENTHGAPTQLNILILGGTSFLGPHQIRYAMERGHSITIFTRGQTQPTVFKGIFRDVEHLVGDRSDNLSALRGRTWDAVIDNSGQRVEWTRDSAELLKDNVETYVYTSSTGVYLPYLGTDIRESTQLVLEDPPEIPEDRRPTYGVMKSLSEIAARNAFGEDRTIVVRPTYIVGPADPTNRFPYWSARLERGGEVMIPGQPDDLVQYIDVRDLTEWMIRLIENRTVGTFNVAGPAAPMGMHAFVHGVHAGTSSAVTWVPIPDYDFLREHEVEFLIPWIMPVGEYVGSARVNIEQSVANGLTFRPLGDTTRDVIEWWHSDAVADERRASLLDGEPSLARREAELIAAWRARG